jgi:DNA-binding MarR family transcriptional regulator
MPEWKFLTNHALVLYLIAEKARITAREIAATIGITEKATRNIINDLESEEYVSKKREGRRLRYQVNFKLPLRHKIQRDKVIGDLLAVLKMKKRKEKKLQDVAK